MKPDQPLSACNPPWERPQSRCGSAAFENENLPAISADVQLLAQMGLAILVFLMHFGLLAFARLLAGLPLCLLSSFDLSQHVVGGSAQHGPALRRHRTVDNVVGVFVDLGQKGVAPRRYVAADLRQRLVLHIGLIHVVRTPEEPPGTQPDQHPDGTTEDADQHSDQPTGRKALTAGIVGALWYLKPPGGVAFDDRRALEFYAALAVKALEGAQRLIRLAPLIESHGNKVHGHGFPPLIDRLTRPFIGETSGVGRRRPPFPVQRSALVNRSIFRS